MKDNRKRGNGKERKKRGNEKVLRKRIRKEE